MDKNVNGKLLDNCIKNDLKLIERDLEIMMLVWTALFAMGLSWGILLLAIPAVIGVLVCVYNLFRKLCSTSIYGSESTLYRSLPVPASTLVLSKIFTGGMTFAALGTVYYICIVFRALLFKDNGIQDAVIVFENWLRDFSEAGVSAGLVPLAAVLDFLNMAVRCFTLSAMILTGVLFYHSLPADTKIRYVQNSTLYIGTMLLMSYLLLQELPGAADGIGSELLRLVFHLILSLMLLVVGYKISVYYMIKKDGGVKG